MTYISKFKVKLLKTYILHPQSGTNHKCVYDSPRFYARQTKYGGCSNMNASGFITFFTYMLRQNGKRFYKGLYVTFKLAPDIKTNTVHLSSYSPWNKGHVSILTNVML